MYIGKGTKTENDGKKVSYYETIKSTYSKAGLGSWISFNLVKYYTIEKNIRSTWNSYLVEVNIRGYDSDTAISNSINIDLLCYKEDEAIKEFDKMFEDFIDNMGGE